MYIIKETLMVNRIIKSVDIVDECFTNKSAALRKIVSLKKLILKNPSDKMEQCKYDNMALVSDDGITFIFSLQKLKVKKGL